MRIDPQEVDDGSVCTLAMLHNNNIIMLAMAYRYYDTSTTEYGGPEGYSRLHIRYSIMHR